VSSSIAAPGVTGGRMFVPYAVAGDLTVLVKSGLRFSRKSREGLFCVLRADLRTELFVSAFIAALSCSEMAAS